MGRSLLPLCFSWLSPARQHQSEQLLFAGEGQAAFGKDVSVASNLTVEGCTIPCTSWVLEDPKQCMRRECRNIP